MKTFPFEHLREDAEEIGDAAADLAAIAAGGPGGTPRAPGRALPGRPRPRCEGLADAQSADGGLLESGRRLRQARRRTFAYRTIMTDALQLLRDQWQAVARYRLYVDRPGRPDEPLAAGQTWTQAIALREAKELELAASPGYRLVMSRPLVVIELENAEAARAAWQTR